MWRQKWRSLKKSNGITTASSVPTQAPPSIALITKYTGKNLRADDWPVSRQVCDGVGGNDCVPPPAPFFNRISTGGDVMEKLQDLALYLASRLFTGNLWAVSRLGLHSHIAYFLLGMSNILIIG